MDIRVPTIFLIHERTTDSLDVRSESEFAITEKLVSLEDSIIVSTFAREKREK